jgi:hypothetical protein
VANGTDDVAGLVRRRNGCGPLGLALLGAQLLDSTAQVGMAVEEVEGDAGGVGQPAEGDGLVTADHLAQG